jgi:L-fuconolactonase
MIDFPIVDTHLHVWDPGLLRYSWLDDIPLLNKPHLLTDYNRACRPVNVEKMVFIQAEADFSQYKQEADWVTSLARADRRIEGIVPWAPLEKGDSVEPELEALSENNLIKGIRRIMEFCLKPDFIRGVRLLEKFNLSFDICISSVHMENTIKFVRKCPDVRFILDHIGKPDIRNQIFEPWKTHLKELSGMPNMWCKMSGLATEADHKNWKREDLKPYIHHVLECFGFDRVMYGGDWPVASLATGYQRWVQVLERSVQGCSKTELKKLFHDNAVAFYKMG